MYKNVSGQTITGLLLNASGNAVNTAAASVYVYANGTSASAGAGSVLFLGGGTYRFRPTQAETNYDHIAFEFRATGAIRAGVQVYTLSGDAYAAIQTAESNLQSGIDSVAGVAGLSSAQVSAIVANGLTNYDAATGTELASGLASVAAVTGLGSAAVSGIVQGVFNSYDPPTNAEMQSAFGSIATLGVYAQGTARSGTAGGIFLASGAVSADGILDCFAIKLTGGQGAGQFGRITASYASNDFASVRTCYSGNVWISSPASGTTYDLLEDTIHPAFLPDGGGSGLSAASASTIVANGLTAYDAATGTELASGLASVAAVAGLGSAAVSGIVQGVFNSYDPPTNAEMQSAFASVGADILLNYSGIGSVASLVGGLNDLSSAQASTIVAGAFATYDGPTNAEMQSAIGSVAAEINLVESGAASNNAGLLTAISGVPADLLGQVIETNGSITFEQAQRGMVAVLFGETDQSGSRFKSPNGSAVRIVVATNDSNNRTSVDITGL